MDTLLIIATWLFLITHLDTFLVLVAFSADETYRKREVLIGHYIGFTLGLFGAVIGAMLAVELLEGRTHLLGILPLSLGLGGLLKRYPEVEIDEEPITVGPIARIGVVTSAGIGLSGENLALFIPFFAGISIAEIGVISGYYLLAAGILYLVAVVTADVTTTVGFPTWLERYLVPSVLTVVGIYVLASGWFLG